MSDFFFGLTTLTEGYKGGWPISKAASTALNKLNVKQQATAPSWRMNHSD